MKSQITANADSHGINVKHEIIEPPKHQAEREFKILLADAIQAALDIMEEAQKEKQKGE